MENSTSCAFFPVIRIAHTEWVKKELDLQQNSLISGCTCSKICTSFLFFAFARSPPTPPSFWRSIDCFTFFCCRFFVFVSYSGGRARDKSRWRGEKKSVISNFLIVIVFVLYCVPLWLFYDLFMKFMLFSSVASTTAHLAQEDHYYAV
jgi:hypothetical protein